MRKRMCLLVIFILLVACFTATAEPPKAPVTDDHPWGGEQLAAADHPWGGEQLQFFFKVLLLTLAVT